MSKGNQREELKRSRKVVSIPPSLLLPKSTGVLTLVIGAHDDVAIFRYCTLWMHRNVSTGPFLPALMFSLSTLGVG